MNEENVETVGANEPTQDVVLDDVSKEPVAHADNSASINMAKLRVAKERAEKERSAMEARVAELEAEKNKPVEETYSDDDFVEGRQLKKELESLRKEQQKFQSEQKVLADENRLKSKYSDFDTIVNTETIEKLKELDPETVEVLTNSKASPYAIGAAAYKRIKELNIIDNHVQDKERAESNITKPRPSNSVSPQAGDGPLSMANAFSDGSLTSDEKARLWKETQQAANRL